MAVVISTSLSSEADVRENGYPLIVRDFSTKAYETLAGTSARTILDAYLDTVAVAAVGTALSLAACSMAAYVLARRSFFLRKQLTFFIFFTMLFNGGLVPTYIVITQIYRLQDTFWVLVLPLVVVPWYIIILRTFMQGISFELIESAKIDGASEFRIFFTIIVPLAKPGLACIGLFILLRYWNSWFEAMLYINRNDWVTLQLMLIRMQQRIEAMFDPNAFVQSSLRLADIPSETLRMAMVVVAAGPMLIIFPFFQKYFVRGLTIGSVKG
jgi:putative aldouronate transport system permease protein